MCCHSNKKIYFERCFLLYSISLWIEGCINICTLILITSYIFGSVGIRETQPFTLSDECGGDVWSFVGATDPVSEGRFSFSTPLLVLSTDKGTL